MVLLLYLWENVKKWSSFDEGEMREPYSYYDGGVAGEGGGGAIGPVVSTVASPGPLGKPYTTDQGYQQMGGLRRLDSSAIIRTHFYPEGGWGWIVCACAFLAHVTTSGAQLSAGALHIVLANKFEDSSAHHWLGPLSWSVSSVFSPLVVNLCRRKNVRILALIGGILFPLSLVFTSFATELHQIFFSFGLIGGIGSCMVRESSGVVLGEYFRKRRQFVEQVVMAGTGVGVTLFSLLYLSFTRHLEWGLGFRLGAAFCTICILLPAFYRSASQYQPPSRSGGSHSTNNHHSKNPRVESPKSPGSIIVPIGGDICRSLNLFCVPSLKPVLWSAAFSSFGLYAPVFLMSDFGRSEGLSGGSLLLLQTHLGLGLSLGVILGAILTLKKFKCCQLSPRMLCCSTAFLTGLSMIAISSVKGYYGYSLSAWIYGVALGSHLYTLKVLTMELTRTKHWSRIWSCVQSLMSPGILLGSGVTSYIGKPGFYACATFVLIGAGLIGYQMIDLGKCGSPQLSSSVDNDSPIPPAPPPISPHKYGPMSTPAPGTVGQASVPPFYPLRRSISLQQPIYPCCREAGEFGFGLGSGLPPPGPQGAAAGAYNPFWPPGYSPYCRECLLGGSPLPPGYLPTMPGSSMIRSYSLPQTGPLPNPSAHLKSTGTQTNPNSPEHSPASSGTSRRPMMHHYPGSYDRLPTLPGSFLPQDRVIRDGDNIIEDARRSTGFGGPTSAGGPSSGLTNIQGPSSYKNTVMFASNPQLFPASNTQSSATSTTDTPTANSHYSHNNNNHLASHNNHHGHHHHHHHPNGVGRHHHPTTSLSPRSSPRHYYPQREERRANFIKSHQRSFDSQQYSVEDNNAQPIHPIASTSQSQQPPSHQFTRQHVSAVPSSSTRFYPTSTVVTVETHKKPGEINHKKSTAVDKSGQPQEKPKEQPAFTRHYFDSSKIQKGRGVGDRVLLPGGGPSTSGHIAQSQIPFRVQPQPSSSNVGAFHLQQQPINAQSRQPQLQALPIQTINAKLIQYQRQQLQQQQEQSHQSTQQATSSSASTAAPPGDFNWRNIQRQQNDANNPFENDPDPPYYPAALSHAQTHAYNAQGKHNPAAKVSSSEFDVEPPKFNSLRRPTSSAVGTLRSSTHNSSMSSQLNYPFSGGAGGGAGYNFPMAYQYFPPPASYHHQHHHHPHYHHHHSQGHQGPGRAQGQVAGGSRGRTDDCIYCDYRVPPPPLSLSVPALQQSDPHYMCHYGYPGAQYLKRRNTWHHHRDQLEAITTSV